MTKTVLSFYIDDTNPYVAPAQAFGTFLDFVSSEGIAGESSCIIGYDWEGHGHLDRPESDMETDYYEQVRRAFRCGIDTHCELFTHNWRYDFSERRMITGGIHEGLWLYEPAVSQAEYEAYFSGIMTEGDRLGVRFTGLTWPGCGCDACQTRYRALRKAGIDQPNPNVWLALLHLAQAGRFRGRSVPTFFSEDIDHASARLMAGDGTCSVYELQPNAGDLFGLWLNDPRYVNADYYITEDGQSGRIVDLVRAGAPYCLFYTHWQGVNPANGVGWDAFTRVIRRVQAHLRDQVTWMRPSQYTESLLDQQATLP